MPRDGSQTCTRGSEGERTGSLPSQFGLIRGENPATLRVSVGVVECTECTVVCSYPFKDSLMVVR